MIFVTGATGNIGRALLDELRTHRDRHRDRHREGRRTDTVKALTRDPARAALPDGVVPVAGDLAEPESWKSALHGARSLFLPSLLGPDDRIVEAALEAGVEHIVLVSSITVQSHPHLGPAQENLAVERLVKASGADWTVLRPTQFASNSLMWAESIRAHEPVHAPYADIPLPTVHPADIAAVARVALTEPGHRGRTYALTGPEPVTARQQVGAIAAALGRDVPFVEVDRRDAYERMAAVFGADAADAVLDVTGGDPNDELLAVRDTVTRITGAPGRTFRQWAAENAALFR
ncbi:SDR family oxidoreductase [Streptomyces sp. Da 82-17]|uniref:SDR family oxidoreductase n=1 Tax=Streptomyces sp. Da 82-17 TaxID=3377116 RepID=UPI0038D4B68E